MCVNYVDFLAQTSDEFYFVNAAVGSCVLYADCAMQVVSSFMQMPFFTRCELRHLRAFVQSCFSS